MLSMRQRLENHLWDTRKGTGMISASWLVGFYYRIGDRHYIRDGSNLNKLKEFVPADNAPVPPRFRHGTPMKVWLQAMGRQRGGPAKALEHVDVLPVAVGYDMPGVLDMPAKKNFTVAHDKRIPTDLTLPESFDVDFNALFAAPEEKHPSVRTAIDRNANFVQIAGIVVGRQYLREGDLNPATNRQQLQNRSRLVLLLKQKADDVPIMVRYYGPESKLTPLNRAIEPYSAVFVKGNYDVDVKEDRVEKDGVLVLKLDENGFAIVRKYQHIRALDIHPAVEPDHIEAYPEWARLEAADRERERAERVERERELAGNGRVPEVLRPEPPTAQPVAATHVREAAPTETAAAEPPRSAVLDALSRR
ncbi:hypothetical protein [Burkholderia territorii]|nr:hypothetical protein [Burkholderia territorii]